MSVPVPLEVGGYVLAGGKSSRMGREKALLELGGKPLIRHAVKKLRRVCMDVRVLSANPEFAAYAPILPDIHPDCGPMSGMEAALSHSIFDWNLFLPVDMPFLPSSFVFSWVRNWLNVQTANSPVRMFQGAQINMFKVDGRPQPGFCLLHKEVRPFLTAALERGDYKLTRVFEEAGRELAVRHGFKPGAGMVCVPMTGFRATRGKGNKEAWCYTTEAQQVAQPLWFANLNTPEDFAEAELHLDALDT